MLITYYVRRCCYFILFYFIVVNIETEIYISLFTATRKFFLAYFIRIRNICYIAVKLEMATVRVHIRHGLSYMNSSKSLTLSLE